MIFDSKREQKIIHDFKSNIKPESWSIGDLPSIVSGLAHGRGMGRNQEDAENANTQCGHEEALCASISQVYTKYVDSELFKTNVGLKRAHKPPERLVALPISYDQKYDSFADVLNSEKCRAARFAWNLSEWIEAFTYSSTDPYFFVLTDGYAEMWVSHANKWVVYTDRSSYPTGGTLFYKGHKPELDQIDYEQNAVLVLPDDSSHHALNVDYEPHYLGTCENLDPTGVNLNNRKAKSTLTGKYVPMSVSTTKNYWLNGFHIPRDWLLSTEKRRSSALRIGVDVEKFECVEDIIGSDADMFPGEIHIDAYEPISKTQMIEFISKTFWFSVTVKQSSIISDALDYIDQEEDAVINTVNTILDACIDHATDMGSDFGHIEHSIIGPSTADSTELSKGKMHNANVYTKEFDETQFDEHSDAAFLESWRSNSLIYIIPDSVRDRCIDPRLWKNMERKISKTLDFASWDHSTESIPRLTVPSNSEKDHDARTFVRAKSQTGLFADISTGAWHLSYMDEHVNTKDDDKPNNYPAPFIAKIVDNLFTNIENTYTEKADIPIIDPEHPSWPTVRNWNTAWRVIQQIMQKPDTHGFSVTLTHIQEHELRLRPQQIRILAPDVTYEKPTADNHTAINKKLLNCYTDQINICQGFNHEEREVAAKMLSMLQSDVDVCPEQIYFGYMRRTECVYIVHRWSTLLEKIVTLTSVLFSPPNRQSYPLPKEHGVLDPEHLFGLDWTQWVNEFGQSPFKSIKEN